MTSVKVLTSSIRLNTNLEIKYLFDRVKVADRKPLRF